MKGMKDKVDMFEDHNTEKSGAAGTAQRHCFNRFFETREYLMQIRNGKHRLELLEMRCSYRWSANIDSKDLQKEIDEEEKRLAHLRVEISDEISGLNSVGQQMVMTRRYVDGMTWDQIAVEMGRSVRAVQKLHGRGLPLLERILAADGKIKLSETDEGSSEGKYEGKDEGAKDGSNGGTDIDSAQEYRGGHNHYNGHYRDHYHGQYRSQCSYSRFKPYYMDYVGAEAYAADVDDENDEADEEYDDAEYFSD